jgi:NAD(P)-dependent dehydrogenase (short-subunit alcohol dehydrogenase family)
MSIGGIDTGQSKLADVLFTQKLASILSNGQVYVNSVNPGDVATGNFFLFTHLDMIRKLVFSYSRILAWFFDRIATLFIFTPYKGALTSLYVATSSKIPKENIRGKYFNPIAKIGDVHQFAKDDIRREALWKLSESLLQEKGHILPKIFNEE